MAEAWRRGTIVDPPPAINAIINFAKIVNGTSQATAKPQRFVILNGQMVILNGQMGHWIGTPRPPIEIPYN